MAVSLREETAVGTSEDGGEFLQREEIGVERIDEGINGVAEVGELDVGVAQREDGALFGADENRLDVAAGEGARAELAADVGKRLGGEGDFFHAGDDGEKLDDFVGRLRGEERDAEAEAALAFEVDGEEIGARSHRDPELAAAQGRVAEVGGEGGEDAAGDAAVAIGGAVAEDGVGFVDDDNDGAEGADREENAGLLALGFADPFRAEFTDLEDGQAALTREAIDEKGFADADAAGDEDAALKDIVFLITDEPGELAEAGFGGGVRGDVVKCHAGARVFEADEALAVIFDEAALTVAHEFDGEFLAGAEGGDHELLDAEEGETGGAARKIVRGEVAGVGEFRAARGAVEPAGIEKRAAFGEIGERYANTGDVRILHEVGVELGGGLGDEHHADVAEVKLGSGGPFEESDEGHAFLDAGAGFLGGGNEFFRETDDESDAAVGGFLFVGGGKEEAAEERRELREGAGRALLVEMGVFDFVVDF